VCSFFVARLVFPAFPHDTLIRWTAGRGPRHSSLTAVLPALILLAL
jgi:hypothetical protein